MIIVAENLDEVQDAIAEALDEMAREVVEATGRASWDTSVEVMADAKSQTPVDTGRLLASAEVGGPYVENESASSEVGYTAPYASIVHEDMQGRHPKFLENAVMAVGPRLRNAVLKELS
jgi:hypothetical protein